MKPLRLQEIDNFLWITVFAHGRQNLNPFLSDFSILVYDVAFQHSLYACQIDLDEIGFPFSELMLR